MDVSKWIVIYPTFLSLEPRVLFHSCTYRIRLIIVSTIEFDIRQGVKVVKTNDNMYFH